MQPTNYSSQKIDPPHRCTVVKKKGEIKKGVEANWRSKHFFVECKSAVEKTKSMLTLEPQPQLLEIRIASLMRCEQHLLV